MPEKFELRQSVSCGRIKKYLQHAYIEGKIIEDNLQTTTNSTPPITQQSQTATPPASQTNSRVGKIVPLEQLG